MKTACQGVQHWSHCYFRLHDDLKVIPDDAGGCCKVGCCAVLDGLKGLEGADAATAGLDDVGCSDAAAVVVTLKTDFYIDTSLSYSWKSRMTFAVDISSGISSPSSVLHSGQGTPQLKQTGMSMNQGMMEGLLTEYATSLLG